MSNPCNQLLPIENPNLSELFRPGGLSELLSRIEAEARSIVPDTSTDKGRKAIASTAARVARSKTYIDGLGKDFVADLKRTTSAVDAERKLARDRLDALKAEVRKPLTDWENAELARVSRHKIEIATIEARAVGAEGLTSAQIAERIEGVIEAYQVHGEWDEFEPEADAAHKKALDALNGALERAKRTEAEQVELAKLRAEAAEREQREVAERAAREQKEREERIAAEAEARARIAAEQAKQAEIDRANQDRIDAERRAAQAEERATMAAKQERERAEAEAAARKAEDDRRAADVEHRRATNAAAVEAIISASEITETQARNIVAAIARGDVPAIHIRY
ncbi:MAG: hypothetical protein EOM22_18960 [Gammaproteobacteria bacterium]|nr:hypothetical protein [Gammaproteobacteria bacterium]